MTLRPLATRVPKEVEQEIREVMDYLKVEKAQAVRIVLEIGISEWRKKIAVELLRDGKVTFAKAAKLAKLDLWDFAEVIQERKVEWVEFPSEDLDEELRRAAKATRQ